MTANINTYGIRLNLWTTWSLNQRIAALAYLYIHIPLMTGPSSAALQLTTDIARQMPKSTGKSAHGFSCQDALDHTTRLKTRLGHLDTKLLRSVICGGVSLIETAAWLFGDSREDATYCKRRVDDTLEEVSDAISLAPVDVIVQSHIIEVSQISPRQHD